MISTDVVPANILALYSWELLHANTGLEKINGIIPIIPIAQEPQLAEEFKDYLVYGYAEQPSTVTKQIKRGTFTLRIVGRSFSQTSKMLATLAIAFSDCEISAANVNLWSDLQPTDLEGLKFTYLDVTYQEGGIPATQEGGPVEGIINIEYHYITQQDIKLFQPNGTWS